ncbi:Ig-like domain-containing protein [Prevotella communis]|uniref:Ig-like domain-containing protein n=1 Tax=Prevotella communis TaxID=2913614 RepID=UPI001EDC56E5|nr:Ig-like domain-containing protein [Prevotella communis]UKK61670.1 Ig-like domain-containing protein [Prevotella communis]UKK64496.1 Ig-like domain-containing protein [Prevotella communis]
MRKISTLAFMAFFCCMSAMAQVVLGDIKFSIKDGAKLNPTTGKITVTFPDVTGVEDPTASTLFIAGNFGPENDFDAEGTLASGITIDFADDYGLEPGTEYTLTITSVKVDGAELAAEGGYKLNFKTRGSERKMSWTFVIDEKSCTQIMEEGNANTEGDATKYQPVGSKNRWYVPSRNYEEIMLPDGTALPMTEDLLFKFGNKSFYVGEYNNGSYKDRICFNNNNQMLVIPDCKVGDVITFSALRSSKNNTYIQAMDGCALAPEGLVSTVTGLKDSIPMGSGLASHKFEVQVEGDVTFKIGNTLMTAITIEEGQEKLPRNYNVVAKFVDEEKEVTLKELVGKTEGTTGSTVKVKYPFWLTDADGNAYTHGTRGSEFVESFDLKNGEGDTTFVVNYNKTAFSGVAFLSEGEDLTGATLCGSNNAVVRSSMGKSAYFAEDVNLCTLQPGSYKVRAVIFDATSALGYTVTLTKGEGVENEIYLTSTLVNFSEVESDLFEITEATNITLKAGGNDTTGLDAIMIYASTDAPEDPDGISEVKDAKKVVARKVAKDGRILIQTAAGTFNAVGVQVK